MNYLIFKKRSISHMLLLMVTFLLAPRSSVLAQDPNVGPSGGDVVTLENPLKVNSIEELLLGVLDIVIIIAIPIVIFFIIYAGFLYATARGNAEKVSQASRALTFAIIGGVLIIGAIAITEIIKNLVGEFQKK